MAKCCGMDGSTAVDSPLFDVFYAKNITFFVNMFTEWFFGWEFGRIWRND